MTVIRLTLVLFVLQPQPKYFHSAVILDDIMVVFGGRSNTSDQLFSHQLLSYNIKCNYWHLFSGNSILHVSEVSRDNLLT